MNKKTTLGTLATLIGASLLAGCTQIIVDKDDIMFKSAKTFTFERVINKETESTVKYDIKDHSFTNSSLNIEIDEAKESTLFVEYDLITKGEGEYFAYQRTRHGLNTQNNGYIFPTGKKETQTLNTKRKTKSINQGISKNPAGYVNVQVTSRNKKIGFKNNYGLLESNRLGRTDIEGKVKFNLQSATNDWDFSKRSLLKKINEHWSVEQIKEPLKSSLFSSIEDLIEYYSEYIEVSTVEVDSYRKKVTNDYETINVLGNYIDYDKVLVLLKNFIDNKINSKIKDVELTVRDIDSHVGLSGAKLEMEIEAPSRVDLADDYFTGSLLVWAVKQIKDYERGDVVAYSSKKGNTNLSVYVPSKFEIEVTHPKYYYTKGKKKFDSNKGFDVDMIEKGSKIRIEKNKGSKNGIITEK